MPQTRAQIEDAIAALRAQRAILGDAIVATALAPLQDQLAALLGVTDEPRRRR